MPHRGRRKQGRHRQLPREDHRIQQQDQNDEHDADAAADPGVRDHFGVPCLLHARGPRPACSGGAAVRHTLPPVPGGRRRHRQLMATHPVGPAGGGSAVVRMGSADASGAQADDVGVSGAGGRAAFGHRGGAAVCGLHGRRHHRVYGEYQWGQPSLGDRDWCGASADRRPVHHRDCVRAADDERGRGGHRRRRRLRHGHPHDGPGTAHHLSSDGGLGGAVDGDLPLHC
mmetsp:Transcript_53205/g.133944  ORF Transcript_53205/g.133944 Transcript_53205/m.133944 type:complete len:228 (+) Transcript_53205:301-984(+)